MRELSAQASQGDYANAFLILLAFALFATDNLVHYPLALMSLLGIVFALRKPGDLLQPAALKLLALFALIWLPMVVSLPGAVNPVHSSKTVWLYLHFFPAAYYLLQVCRSVAVYRLVCHGVVALLLFVAFDAFAQLIWGEDFFGYPYDGNILKGVFYPKQRIGLFLAVLAPLYIDVLRRWCSRYAALWIMLIPIVVVIVTTLKRSAWLMVALSIIGYLLVARKKRSHAGPEKRTLGIVLGVVVVVAVAVTALSSSVQRQLVTSAGVFSIDVDRIDRATSYRVSLWRTGVKIFMHHPWLGIGPRGYRSAYATFAAKDDFWLARNGTGQTHPHLLVLEVAVETGVVGLIGLVMFFALLVTTIARASDGPFLPVWLLCAGVAWFPLNAHLSFYGSYWATLAWLLIGIGMAVAVTPAQESSV